LFLKDYAEIVEWEGEKLYLNCLKGKEEWLYTDEA